jgi:hypothetical protein
MKWVATVEAWEIVAQEVRFEIERDIVKDVHVRSEEPRTGARAPA